MKRYICLLRFTEQGVKKIKQSTKRANDFQKLAAKAGVKIEAQYWTLGALDGVIILSSDSQEKALRCLAQLAALGNVRTETFQAFNKAEFDRLVAT